jgi:hypothetical protein
VSPRNTIISIGIVLTVMWCSSDFITGLVAFGFDHSDAVVAWGIALTIVWNLRDE